MTVQGVRAAPEAASTVLVTARDLVATPQRSAEDGLRLVPGVTLVQHGSEGKGYQFLLRGFDAAHGADFEVSVEGIPLNEWSNVHAQGYIDLGFVIPELVESIRVTKGPFTLVQGAFAVAGSAQYHLGVPEHERGLRAAYTIGTTNRHRGLISYSPPRGDGHDFIASETLHDDGFGNGRTVNKGTLLSQVTLFAGSSGRLSLLTAASMSRFELPGALRYDDYNAGRIGFRNSYDLAGRGASLRGLGALAYQHSTELHQVRAVLFLTPRRLEILENFTGFLRDSLHGDRRAQRHEALNVGLDFSHMHRLTSVIDVEWGVGGRVDLLDQEQWHVGQSQERLERERAVTAIQALANARLGLGIRPLRHVRLHGGVRFEIAHVNATDHSSTSTRDSGALPLALPRAILEWHAHETLRLVAAYGRGFRPPEARAFTGIEPAMAAVRDELAQRGEPAMTTVDSFELGARFRASHHFFAQATGFATFVARESVYDHVSGLNLELNGTRRLGLELALRWLPTPWLTFTTDATAVRARFTESGNPIPLAPTLSGGVRALAGGAKGPGGGVRLLAVAPRALPHGSVSSAFSQLDAVAGYDFGTHALELELENVLNQRSRDDFHFASHWERDAAPSYIPTRHYFPAPPLNLRLTLSAVF